MFDIRLNVLRNYANIVVKGKLEAAEIQSAADRILKEVKLLQPGFVIISDVREMAPTSEDGRILVQGLMNSVRELGLAAAIRVISPASQITANQMQRTSRAIGYTAQEVNTPAEAERLLNEL